MIAIYRTRLIGRVGNISKLLIDEEIII